MQHGGAIRSTPPESGLNCSDVARAHLVTGIGVGVSGTVGARDQAGPGGRRGGVKGMHRDADDQERTAPTTHGAGGVHTRGHTPGRDWDLTERARALGGRSERTGGGEGRAGRACGAHVQLARGLEAHRLSWLVAAASFGRLREEVGPISAATSASADTRGRENRAAICGQVLASCSCP